MKSGNRQDLPRIVAIGVLLLAAGLFWLNRPSGTPGPPTAADGSAAAVESGEKSASATGALPSPPDHAGAASGGVITTLATQTPPAGAPVPPALDLRSLPLPVPKGDDPPVLVLPGSAVLDPLEALFASEPGTTVVVPLGDGIRFTGTLLRKDLQPGTRVLGVSVSDGTSSLHLERTRRGDYRGSIVHRFSPVAHRLATREDGAFVVEQRTFHELVCAAPGATPQSASGLPLAAGIDPAEASTPAESEVAEATPPSRDSRPSATAVIYLDFDGQSVTGTEWNTLRNVTPINAAASTLTTNEMDEVWARVAEDFAPFHISVTTNAARYTNAPQNRRIRVIITPTSSWYGSAGGVAYLGSFTWTGDTPLLGL